jgi:integrase
VRGSIRRRSKGSWELTLDLGHDPVTGDRLRRFANVKGTRRDAERELAARIHAIETGTSANPARETVAEFLQRWLRDYAAPTVSPRTCERYEEAIATHIVPSLGSIRLASLRPAHIVAAEQEWRLSGRRRGSGGLSAATVRHHHAVLRRALQIAVSWQILAVNPAQAVTPPRAPRRDMAALDADQAAILLSAARGSEFEVSLVTALYTGLRLSELRGLRWRDVDLAGARLSIQQTLQRRRDGSLVVHDPKTHRSRRSVSLPGTMVAVLREHRRRQLEQRLLTGDAWAEPDLVFTDGLGRPLSETRLRYAFHQLLRQAGLPHIRLHDLRHTMATLMLSQGEHPKVVSERLGHSSVSITLDTYSHVLPSIQAAAAERLAAALEAAPAARDQH